MGAGWAGKSMGRLSCLRAAGSPGYPGGTGTHLHSHGGRRRAGGSTPRGPRRAARHLGTVPAHSSPAIPFLSQVSRDPVPSLSQPQRPGPRRSPLPGPGWAGPQRCLEPGRGGAPPLWIRRSRASAFAQRRREPRDPRARAGGRGGSGGRERLGAGQAQPRVRLLCGGNAPSSRASAACIPQERCLRPGL